MTEVPFVYVTKEITRFRPLSVESCIPVAIFGQGRKPRLAEATSASLENIIDFCTFRLITDFIYKIIIHISDIIIHMYHSFMYRHPGPELKFHYVYRFQAPDSYSYDVSWSDFRNEKLENFNWNYLDHYICTRGESEYGLMEVRYLY